MTVKEFINFCDSNFSIEDNNDTDCIIKCKNGSKIHIKKKNRGTFTKYCKGKVTEECIRKGKNSPNPAIRKKATFAQNSRRWHK